MKFYTDPNFVRMDFSCPYCSREATATVHEDGAACCDSCCSEIKPPMTYHEAYKQQTGEEVQSMTH